MARWGDRPGLVVRSQNVRWSYAELGARADAFAAGLLALGLQPGERVGIWSLNNAEWLVTQIATAKAGLILVNVNPAYRIAELEFALNKVGVAALVTATAFKTSDYMAMLRELLPELTVSTPGALHAARVPTLRTVIQIGGASPGTIPFDEVGTRGGADARPPGRAGRHAAVRRPDQHPVHLRHHRQPEGHHPHPPQRAEQRLLHRRGHAADRARTGCASRCRCTTASAWCWATWPRSPTAPAWSTRARASTRSPCWRPWRRSAAPALHGVPTMFIAEMEHPRFAEFDLSSLRTGIMAGSPCPIEVMRRVVDRMHLRDITICYGMTETSPVSFQTTATTRWSAG